MNLSSEPCGKWLMESSRTDCKIMKLKKKKRNLV